MLIKIPAEWPGFYLNNKYHLALTDIIPVLAISPPFFNYFFHIIRNITFKMYRLPCSWMNKAQFFCMQRLPLADGKTIINKLFVFGKDGPLYNFIATIKIIIKQWMADVLHVYPYLVSAASL